MPRSAKPAAIVRAYGRAADPEAYASAVVRRFLPNLMPYVVGTPASFASTPGTAGPSRQRAERDVLHRCQHAGLARDRQGIRDVGGEGVLPVRACGELTMQARLSSTRRSIAAMAAFILLLHVTGWRQLVALVAPGHRGAGLALRPDRGPLVDSIGLGVVGLADPDFPDDQQDRGGGRDGKQGADHAEEGAAEEGRDDCYGAGNVYGSAHDARGDDVVLDLLVNDAVREADGAGPETGGEADQGDDHDADQAADHGDEVAEHDHDRQRHGVLTQADDLQEDEHAHARAEGDHELAADVTADAGQDLVAEDGDAGPAGARDQAVRRPLHRRKRREEVQRQDQDRESVEQCARD